MRYSLNSRIFFLGALAIGALSACGRDRQMQSLPSESSIENTSGSALDIGRGFNTHSATTRGKCVEKGTLVPKGGTASQQVSFELQEIQSFESLAKSMSFNASGRFGSGIYGGSASYSYFESSDYTAYSSYLLAHVKVVDTDMALNELHLTADAKAILAQGPGSFFEACGDSFVSQVTEGGEFYAVVEFKSKSEEQKKQVEAKIRGSGGAWSFGAQFKQNMEEMSQIAETNVKIIRIGGSGALPDFGNPSAADYHGLIDYALKFPQAVASDTGKPWVISYTVEDYGVIADVHLPSPDLLAQKDAIERMGTIKLTFKAVDNRIQYILRNPNEFADVDAPSLQAASNKVQGSLNALNLQAKKCLQSPFDTDACKVPTDSLVMPDVKWPAWSGGLISADQCEYGRLWAERLGILPHSAYEDMVLKDWTVYFHSNDPASGLMSIGVCSNSDDALNHLPISAP